MPDPAHRSLAQPAVVLGLTFLLIGLTFALPFGLVPQSEIEATSEFFSPEIANVYACVAWAGWAHFLFAFRGQGKALVAVTDNTRAAKIAAYISSVAVAVLILVGLRWAMGASLFGAIVWLYFIDHFLKAEQTFEGKRVSASLLTRWMESYQILLTFGWLSAVLLNVGHVSGQPWLLWTTSLLLGAMVLVFGGWRKLTEGDSRGPLLSLFFVAEALVWGAFSRHSSQMFLTGVYVIHIAAGSYFHYLGAYFFANAKAKLKEIAVMPLFVLLINFTIIGLGYFVAHQDSLGWLSPIVGIQWFTLWVAVHLVSSDVFPLIRSRKLNAQRSA